MGKPLPQKFAGGLRNHPDPFGSKKEPFKESFPVKGPGQTADLRTVEGDDKLPWGISTEELKSHHGPDRAGFGEIEDVLGQFTMRSQKSHGYPKVGEQPLSAPNRHLHDRVGKLPAVDRAVARSPDTGLNSTAGQSPAHLLHVGGNAPPLGEELVRDDDDFGSRILIRWHGYLD